ncbi:MULTISPECIES: 1-phosphofructokinase [Bacillaceae]|uniref:1-phosphofructokinase n=1 Tax=Bacillaceae TaxID=186817 RepID=UPI000BED0860|nr:MULTISPECIES: 1-phosphofructokinase [unclassified Bacillus (in: firmicutes)]PEC49048.1 1-phosphofructokinase [Bacillus sp. AFS096315]PFM74717.1 1-phosphofructokinase [Bacillus sp. AFS077874]
MIYTVTLNPSIDYIVEVEDLGLGKINRMKRENKFPGGKGINVSRVLKRLDVESIALGFVGGFTGDFIKNVLENESVTSDFVQVEGDSRINIKLKSLLETEINGQGPAISEEKLDQFFYKLKQIKKGDYVVLAGNIPNTLPADLYEQLTLWGQENGIHIIVDASGKVLLDVVKHRPFFIKPNHHELGDLFDVKITSIEQAIPYGKKLVDMGAQNVGISFAGDGAILITESSVYISNVPKGEVINSVGAGDSLVAGFVGTYVKTNNIETAFKVGVASGSATAFSEDLTKREKIEELLNQVKIEKD